MFLLNDSMTDKDYYDILEIDKNASEADIKKAYKKQAMIWHPDRNHSNSNKDKAEKKFKEISEAYQVLIDKDKRAVYDKYGKDGFKPVNFAGAATAEEMFNKMFSSLFEDADNNDSDDNSDVNVDMDDDELWDSSGRFNFGSAANFMPPGLAEQLAEQLANGEGGGTYTFTQNIFRSNTVTQKPIECDLECTLEELYTGKKKTVKIVRDGLLGPESRSLKINVLAGWKEGTKITFKNEGHIKPKAVPSDIIVTVKELPHDVFKRAGDNMITTIDITLNQALSGFKKRIKTLTGSYKIIKVNKLKESKEVYVVKGEGMPIRKGGERIGYGDLIVKFNILL